MVAVWVVASEGSIKGPVFLSRGEGEHYGGKTWREAAHLLEARMPGEVGRHCTSISLQGRVPNDLTSFLTLPVPEDSTVP